MTRYFMRDAQLARIEANMMLVPFYTRRYSAVMILNRFQYNSENTNCKYCTAYHKGKGCTEKSCYWPNEQLEAGTVPYNELINICFENLQNKRLKARLRHLISGYCCGWYYDNTHQRRFEQAVAALRINLVAMPQVRCGTVLADHRCLYPYQAAKTLYTGNENITVAELADPELIDGPLLTIIVGGILITRFGTDVFQFAKEARQ